jgi:hypothetical protein
MTLAFSSSKRMWISQIEAIRYDPAPEHAALKRALQE